MNDDGSENHLENLEAYGFDRGRKTDADPVGQNDAGTLEVGAADFMMNLESQDKIQDSRRNEPREHGGKRHTLDAHLREAQVAVQEGNVHRGVRDDGDDVTEQVPGGESVGGDECRKRRLQGAEGKAYGDDMQKVAGVPGGIAGKSHPSDNLVGKRDDDQGDGDTEQKASEKDHGLCGARLPGTFSSDKLGGDARPGLGESLDGHEKGAQDGHQGAHARGRRFGSARQEPTVHHRLARSDTEGNE